MKRTTWSLYIGIAFLIVGSGLLLWFAMGWREVAAFTAVLAGIILIIHNFLRQYRQTNQALAQENKALQQEMSRQQQQQAQLSLTHHQYTAELERRNKELEEFAYVASHDLQEPLRIIASYLQLLSRRYEEKLDDDGRRFINHAVDGATRMRDLINALLSYSRLGTRAQPFAPTDCGEVLQAVLNNLQLVIEENSATITCDPLPTVMGDAQQLMQLLQNLLSNAIKFHGDSPPQIHLTAQRQNGFWQFAVNDNGIGINPQDYERIFLIFQRLHGRGEYPGTGIGLAICKKIVEWHNGRIWAESQPGQGTTFYFTLPAL